ncbi:hypothetical protein Bhyg_07359 [Pseudolycoriella hygida]|uniref:CCHC-type domain-containing protein n=1 Tax=Pseudolycoriella hygida TaxID=35572 RepID=A0A9Q0N3U2_9DIPT|nr:hypothetical protein Bhyg_07359 [Pseudolycoriella hygida]
MKKLDKCIKAKPNLPSVSLENDADKLVDAKSILSLSVEESLIVHIRFAKSALEIWNILQHLYEDKGLLRKTSLLRALMSVRLEEANSMQAYVEEIMELSNRLNCIGFEIGDEWLASILLAGLTEEYNPFIMSIEGSGIQISADMVKQKLLDSDFNSTSSQGNALYTGKKSKFRARTRELICFNCGGKNHKAAECKKDGKSTDTSHTSTNSTNQQAATAKVTPLGDIVDFKEKSDISKVLTADDMRENDADNDDQCDAGQLQTIEDQSSDDEQSDQSVVVISDSSSSEDTIVQNTSHEEDDTFDDVDNTFDDPTYVPNESEWEDATMFVRHQQLNRYIVKCICQSCLLRFFYHDDTNDQKADTFYPQLKTLSNKIVFFFILVGKVISIYIIKEK